MLKNNLLLYISLTFVYVFMIVTCKEVKAYEYPTNSLYIEYNDASMGQIKVFLPSNQVSCLSYEEGDLFPINISSNTIYGYFTYQGEDYRYTFPTFDVPYTRLNGSYNNTYMSILNVIDTNIDFIESNEMYLLNEFNYKNILLYTTLIGGFFLCLIWCKR